MDEAKHDLLLKSTRPAGAWAVYMSYVCRELQNVQYVLQYLVGTNLTATHVMSAGRHIQALMAGRVRVLADWFLTMELVQGLQGLSNHCFVPSRNAQLHHHTSPRNIRELKICWCGRSSAAARLPAVKKSRLSLVRSNGSQLNQLIMRVNYTARRCCVQHCLLDNSEGFEFEYP